MFSHLRHRTLKYGLFILLPFLLAAGVDDPVWWKERNLTTGQPSNDYAPINQGQAKHTAVKAYDELQATLEGGAGAKLTTFIGTLSLDKNNYEAVNNGQLKNLATPFYDRLIEIGYVQGYPWDGKVSEDYAMSNNGQLKNLFNFNLRLPDDWKAKYGDPTKIFWDTDLGSGQPAGIHYQKGTDPTGYYGGILPILNIMSGNNQKGDTNDYLPQPLVLEIRNKGGALLKNAPITFKVSQGGGGLVVKQGDAVQSSLKLLSDNNGKISVFWYLAVAETNRVIATALSGTSSTQVEFNATNNLSSIKAPTQNGLVLWLNSEKGITQDGSNHVSKWADQSGKANDAAQADLLAQPLWVTNALNGKPALRFDGKKTFLNFKQRLTNIRTVFWVIREDPAATASERFLLGDSSNYDFHSGREHQLYHAYTSPYILGGQTRINSGFPIDGTVTNRPTNFSIISLVTTGNVSASNFTKDRYEERYWHGGLAELLIYDQPLSQSDRITVEAYLNQKYKTFNAVPSSPQLTAEGISSTRVHLSWKDAATYKTQYRIERKTGPGGNYSPLATVDGNTLAYVDSTAAAGVNYFYRVQLLNNFAGLSPWSNEAEVTTTPQSGSILPLNGLVTWFRADMGVNSNGDNQVSSWADLSGSGNDAMQINLSAQPLLVSNVLNGKPALRFDGKKTFLNFKQRLTSIRTVFWVIREDPLATLDYRFLLGDSINYDFHSGGTHQLYSWPASSNILGGQTRINSGNPIDGTITNRPTQFSIISLVTTGNVSASNFTQDRIYGRYWHGDLAELLIYDQALSNSDRITVEAYLNQKYKIFDAPQPSAPQLTVDATSPTQVSLFWKDQVKNKIQYRIERKTGPNGDYSLLTTVNGDASTYIDSTGVPGADYFYRIQLTNVGGVSPWSDEIEVTTPQSGAALPLKDLVAWFRADIGITDDGANHVGLWTDWSGYGNHAFQANLASKPLLVPNDLNSKPVLRFDGAQNFLQTLYDPSYDNGSGLTIFMVTRPQGPLMILGRYYGPWRIGIQNGKYFYEITEDAVKNDNGGSIQAGTVQLGQPQVISMTYQNQTSRTFSVNGTLLHSSSVEGVLPQSKNLGLFIGGTQYDSFFKGDIAEIFVYRSALSTTNRKAIEQYLNSKYLIVDSVPEASSDLSAMVVDSQINLAWINNSSNESGIEIERKIGMMGVYSQVAVVAPATTAWIDPNAVDGIQYFYRVRSVNMAGNAAYSNEANATIPLTIPQAPSDLSANAVSTSQVHLAWLDRSYNETGFKIDRKAGGDGVYAQLTTVGANITTYEDLGLTQGTDYFYRVRATNATGDSDYSNEADAIPGKVSTPIFSLVGGTYASGRDIVISCGTPGVEIHYTTNGNDPTQMDPIIASGSFIWVDHNLTLKAKAWKTNWTASEIQTGIYNVTGMIASGNNHLFALRKDGKAWAWGEGSYCKLGLGENWSSQFSPVLIDPFDHVISVAGGEQHSVAARADGTVWCWGANFYGEQGNGTKIGYQNKPTQIPGFSNVKAVAAGNMYSLALKNDGTVWAWGYLWGQSYFSRSRPFQIDTLKDVVAIAAGSTHSLAVKSDGTIWAWGKNNAGQLGTVKYDDTGTPPIPVQVVGLTDGIAVAAGYGHSLALKSDGTVWAWGSNSNGQLGTGKDESSPSAVQVVGLTDAIAIAAGENHSLAVKSDGTVWAWGSNAYNQVWEGAALKQKTPIQVPGLSNIIAVAGGSLHSAALQSDGTIWTWGWNNSGQLGDGGIVFGRGNPLQMSSVESVPSVIAPTFNPPGGDYTQTQKVQISSPTAGAEIRYTTNGNDPTLNDPGITSGAIVVVTSNTTLKAKAFRKNWNDSAVTSALYNIATDVETPIFNPDGGTYQQATKVTVTCPTVGAVIHYTTDGRDPTVKDPVIVSGSDFTVNGSLTLKAGAWKNGSDPGPVQTASYTIEGSVATPIFSVLGGTYSAPRSVVITCMTDGAEIHYTINGKDPTLNDPVIVSGSAVLIDAHRTLKAKAFKNGWNPSAIRSAIFTIIGKVSTGSDYYSSQTLGISYDGAARGWGGNGSGQLGIGQVTGAKLIPVPVIGGNNYSAMACGQYHSLLLKNDGTVWACGRNFEGQLGIGIQSDQPSPVQVIGLSSIVAIAAGQRYSLALDSKGIVWAWGKNESGQLGDGTSLLRNKPVQVSKISDVIAIAAGSNHSLAIKSDRTVWAWGSNVWGQLGSGVGYDSRTMPVQIDGMTDAVAVAGGEMHSIALKSDGTVWVWGNNVWVVNKKPQQVNNLTQVVSIASGLRHNIVLKLDGTVWAWGANDFGLGDGISTQSVAPVQVKNLNGISSIAAGGNASFAVKANNGIIWAWGANAGGQLGDGTNKDRKLPVQVVFFHLSNWDDTGDGIPSWLKLELGLDPFNPFSVSPWLSDGTLLNLGYGPADMKPDADPDGDGLTNAEELLLGTDPFNPDTDGDGHMDSNGKVGLEHKGGDDYFPLDPTRWALPPGDPMDHTPPVIKLDKPTNAVSF